MKSYRNLWDKICNFENFKLAYHNATKGKKYYSDVKAIEAFGVDEYLKNLLEEVKQNKYKVSKYHVFHKITGGKDREIWRLPMKDRIVQHAIMIHIEPIFRENFIVDTFSSIKGRGIHRGLKRVKKALRNTDYKYCLKLDIRKCYPSIDQKILKKKLKLKFKDKKLLNLLYIIIDSCDSGVPIGNYTSLYFNNFYFSELDHKIKEQLKVKHYFRYCDDLVILGKDKEYLKFIFKQIKLEILKLNVEIKGNHLISIIEDRSIDFLGFRIRNNYVKIRKHIKKNFINKMRSMDVCNLTDKNLNVLGSYWGIIKHADCRTLWQKYTGSKDLKNLKQSNAL